MSMMQDRFSVLGQVDTGPTTVQHLTPEIASGVLFFTSIAYLLGSEGFKRWFDDQLKTNGLKELPHKWQDHIIVIDPQRLIFDQIAKEKPDKIALIHTGNILHGEVLEGGQLKSGKRRHLNALTPEHLSDKDFLAMANPTNAEKWIINLWPPDRALYSTLQLEDNNPQPLSPEKAANTIRTLSNNWKNQNVTVILPKGAKWAFREAASLFTKDRFPLLGSINVITPEEVITRKLQEASKGRKIAIISDMETVKNEFENDLRAKGVEITGLEDSDVVVVYCSNDDIGNEIVGIQRKS